MLYCSCSLGKHFNNTDNENPFEVGKLRFKPLKRIDMRTIGNLLWFLLGGVFMGLAWFLFGVLAFITILGIPWGRACFVIGKFSFFPFGKEAISRKDLNNADDIGTGTFGIIGNILWFVFAGIWLAIGHLITAVACFITIIGIPFSLQHLKLAGISLAPIGQVVVSKEVAKIAMEGSARNYVDDKRDNS